MISDYPELIAEVSERSGVSDVATRAKMFVGMAEKMLSKRLRLANMEVIAELTTNDTGEADLPSNYQEMRSIRVNDHTVERKPLDVIIGGHQCGYVVQGKKLKSTYKSTTHKIIYYSSVPNLEENNTSWLLDEEPELYLQAVLFQVYTAKSEIEKAQATASYIGALIEAANEADYANRHSGTRINFGSVIP